MTRLLNAMKMHMASMDASAPVGRWGIVTSANGATVKVRLQPEDVQTDWLPVLSNMVGGGWGMIHVPAVGTQVFCIPDAGDADNYVVAGATWNTSNPPPAAASGETWLVHSSGSAIKLTNDGKVSVSDGGGCSLVFNNDGTATFTGNLRVTGSITGGYGSGDAVSLQTHQHGTGSPAAGTSAPTAGT